MSNTNNFKIFSKIWVGRKFIDREGSVNEIVWVRDDLRLMTVEYPFLGNSCVSQSQKTIQFFNIDFVKWVDEHSTKYTVVVFIERSVDKESVKETKGFNLTDDINTFVKDRLDIDLNIYDSDENTLDHFLYEPKALFRFSKPVVVGGLNLGRAEVQVVRNY